MLLPSIEVAGQTIHVADEETAINNSKPGSENAIDKVQYRVTYTAKFVNDTIRRDSLGNYKYSEDDMRLDIGNTISEFYSVRKTVYDKWMKGKIARGEVDFTNPPARPSMTWTVYRNYPIGETSFLDVAMMNYCRISEKTITPEWTVKPDTCTILNYHCTKAETDFKGRHWTVWFTEDIPLDYGPWKLIGLPGLILKAEDSQKQYVFEASGLEQIDGKEDIAPVKNYKKYELVTQKQFDKINRTTSANDALAVAGISISFGNTTVKGMDSGDLMKKMKEIPPYNPIEIVE